MSVHVCEICGEPMPESENMFKFHGYSTPCPKPPLPKKEPTHKAADGTERQDHYGTSGRQPWDDIRDAGWGPEFCAGNALKYIRRDHKIKGVERERDLKHARWYFARLHELTTAPDTIEAEAWNARRVLDQLTRLLTQAEVDLLENP